MTDFPTKNAPFLRSPLAAAFRARNDSIRALYEDTPVPVREIARLVGVTERKIYALVRRLGCRPRRQLAGDGRRVVPRAAPTTCDLNSENVQRVVQRCSEAVAHAKHVAAATRAARDERIARHQARRSAEADARTLLLVARAMRDLAAITSGAAARKAQRIRAKQAKPRKPRYQWRPMLVSPTD
jgi:hypothetical protein